MNTRIQELIRTKSTILFPGTDVVDCTITDIEKFAELILADVIAIIEDPKSYNKCVFTNFDESRARCVSVELIKEINQKFKDVK